MLLKHRDWLSKLFSLRGNTFEVIWPRVAACTALSILITGAELHFGLETWSLTTTPFLLMGVALSILLGFINSAVYDRWWEGRKLWGRMVNISRSFTRQVLVFLDAAPQSVGSPQNRLSHRDAFSATGNGSAAVDHHNHFDSDHSGNGYDATGDLGRVLIVRMIAYVHSLRHHLRDRDPGDDLRRLLPPTEVADLATRGNVPIAILEVTGRLLRDAYRDDRLTDYQFVTMEASLVEMTGIQGGCERIKNTPIPGSYTVLIHRLVAFYCFTLPFGIVETVGWLTPIVVLLIAHTFYGLDALGEEIEEPFGFDANDLPLESLCRTIEGNLRQSLGEAVVNDGAAEHHGVVQ